jgi:hypothetical protein
MKEHRREKTPIMPNPKTKTDLGEKRSATRPHMRRKQPNVAEKEVCEGQWASKSCVKGDETYHNPRRGLVCEVKVFDDFGYQTEKSGSAQQVQKLGQESASMVCHIWC